MENLSQDLRDALRLLLKKPPFSPRPNAYGVRAKRTSKIVLILFFLILNFHGVISRQFALTGANSLQPLNSMTPFNSMTPVNEQSPASEKPAEQVYSNIRVLKGLPASQIQGAMDFMSAALGVDCAYCHSGAYAKDDKVAKQVSRNMIKMTLDLNKSSFGGSLEVTCYTCHRGQIAPVPSPPAGIIATSDSLPLIDSGRPLPSADQIIEQYISALGGRRALASVTTLSINALTINADRSSSRIALYRKAPDKLLIVSKSNAEISREGFDGKRAWTSSGEAISEPDSDSVARIIRDSEFYPAISMRERYKNPIVGGEVRLGKRPAFMVIATAPDGKPERFFFDETNGLLLRRVIVTKTAMGELYTQADFDDYTKVGLVRLPFSTRWSSPGKSSTRKITSVKQNVRINDEKFQPPERTHDRE